MHPALSVPGPRVPRNCEPPCEKPPSGIWTARDKAAEYMRQPDVNVGHEWLKALLTR